MDWGWTGLETIDRAAQEGLIWHTWQYHISQYKLIKDKLESKPWVWSEFKVLYITRYSRG